jgi:signal peptidase II
MADPLRENRLMVLKFVGPLTKLGLLLAALIFALDQISKFWILRIVNLDERGPISITPFMDLVMAWNRGISYGLFETHAQEVLIGLSLVISLFLVSWLARAKHPLQAGAIGILIGGAIGNTLDRVLHGAVADFVLLHWGNWNWYVFNVADIAIVAGVALLFYDGLFSGGEKKSG